MKKRSIILLMLCFPLITNAYERSMLNLPVPSGLQPRQLQFSVHHRFYGDFDEEPFETFFGLLNGANVGLGLRGSVLKGLDLSGSYIVNYMKEYQFALHYSRSFPKLHASTMLCLQYFSYKPDYQNRQSGIFPQLSIQSDPIISRLSAVMHLGYDSYMEHFGFSLGLDVSVTKRLSLIGEYFPGKLSDAIYTQNTFAFGIKIRTYGHHFMIVLGNNTSIGTRLLMHGATDENLHVGFVIHRLLEI